MAETATVTIQSVTSKETSKGPMYIIKDGNGVEYASKKAEFFEKAKPLEGKQAVVEFKVAVTTKDDGRTFTNRYIEGVRPAQSESPIAARTDSGEADWDLIGLRKTRCALWVAVLTGADPTVMAAPEWLTSSRKIVAAAERDIFTRPVAEPKAAEPAPAVSDENSDDDIPFRPTIDGVS